MQTEDAKTRTLTSRKEKWGSGFVPSKTQTDVGPPPSSIYSSFSSLLPWNWFKSGPKTIPNPILAPGQTKAPLNSSASFNSVVAAHPITEVPSTESVEQSVPSMRRRFWNRLKHPLSRTTAPSAATIADGTATTIPPTTNATTTQTGVSGPPSTAPATPGS